MIKTPKNILVFIKGGQKTRFTKGMIPWNKGKKYKMGKNKVPSPRKGKHLSDIHKKRISKSNYGKKWNEKRRENFSLLQTGDKKFIGFKSNLRSRIESTRLYLEWKVQFLKEIIIIARIVGTKDI